MHEHAHPNQQEEKKGMANNQASQSPKPQPEPSSLLTIKQVAQQLNVSVRTIENEIADGRLTPLRIRGVRRFTRQQIAQYVRSQTR